MLWWEALSEDQQDDVAHCVGLLAELGPALGFPYSSKVNGFASRPYARVAHAERRKTFEDAVRIRPLRTAILLLGGDKTGDDRWYEKLVPMADRLYDQHLDELKKEGKL